MSGSTYYVPEQSKWPILASIALGLLAYGAAMTITSMTADRESIGPWILAGGFFVIFYVIFGWFKDQIREEAEGLHSDQLDRSYRQGMLWFIFSEVMFFAAFFWCSFLCSNIFGALDRGRGRKRRYEHAVGRFQRDVAFITDSRYETVPRR